MKVCRCSGQGLANCMAAALDTSAVSLPEIEADTAKDRYFVMAMLSIYPTSELVRLINEFGTAVKLPEFESTW
jgi:hypothetical protein